MADDKQTRRENAKHYARRVIEGSFNQPVDDDVLDSVAEKILRVLPAEYPSEAKSLTKYSES